MCAHPGVTLTDEEPAERAACPVGVFERQWLPLLALASGLTGSRATGEDVVQDVFEAVTRSRPVFPSDAAAGAYLRKAVLNRSRSVHRRNLVRRAYEATLPRGDAIADAVADTLGAHAELLDALRSLRWRPRAVLVLRYWCDLSDADIATCLDMSVANVRTVALRAQRTLAARLEGNVS